MLSRLDPCRNTHAYTGISWACVCIFCPFSFSLTFDLIWIGFHMQILWCLIEIWFRWFIVANEDGTRRMIEKENAMIDPATIRKATPLIILVTKAVLQTRKAIARILFIRVIGKILNIIVLWNGVSIILSVHWVHPLVSFIVLFRDHLRLQHCIPLLLLVLLGRTQCRLPLLL